MGGLLAPRVPAVGLSVLLALRDNCMGRVRYQYGAKASDLRCDSSQISALDCSGWTRYALYRSTGGKLRIPDGSQQQLAWAQWAGLHRVQPYANAALYAGNDAGRLFICFLRVEPGVRSIGHVWLTYLGRTIEMHGPEGAPMSARPWNTPALVGCVDCYELPTVA